MSETHTLHTVVDDLKHRLHDAGHKISDVSHSAGHKLSDMGHKVGESFQVQHLALCKVCHAELEAADVAQGCCSDSEACGCRAYTARCW